MTDELSFPEPHSRGKGDAVVTYGTVSALFNKITKLDTKFDAFLGVQEERKAVQDAHALALKLIETRLTIIETKSDTSRKWLAEVWAVLIAIFSLIVSAVSGATSIIWHVR